MFFRIVKMLVKPLAIACIVEIIREKLTIFLYKFQNNFKRQLKKMTRIFFLVFLGFILFSLGLRFLLYGLASWLNTIFASTYLGFFIVSALCFLMFTLIICALRSKMNNQEATQEEITDLE